MSRLWENNDSSTLGMVEKIHQLRQQKMTEGMADMDINAGDPKTDEYDPDEDLWGVEIHTTVTRDYLAKLFDFNTTSYKLWKPFTAKVVRITRNKISGRFKLLITDNVISRDVSLATDLHPLITSGDVSEGSLIFIYRFTCTKLHEFNTVYMAIFKLKII